MPDEPMLVSIESILHARRGHGDLARECVRKALDSRRSFGQTPHTYYNIACVHAVPGEVDKALAWLERAADTRFPCWPYFKVDPNLQNVRHEPAFGRLVADLEATYTATRIQRV